MSPAPTLASLLFLVLLGVGCATVKHRAVDVEVQVTDITTPEVPVRMPGAVATWTRLGFLAVPARGGAFGLTGPAPVRKADDGELKAEDGELPVEPDPPPALLFSRTTRAWQRVPGIVPTTGPAFDAAYPLGEGAVVLTGIGGWRVDVERGAWSALEGGPVGRMSLREHAARPGAVFLYGQDNEGLCAAWELNEQGWTLLPPPPCAQYVRFAADAERWLMFWDVDGEMRSAALSRGAKQWTPLSDDGAPDAFGAATAGDGWVALHGIRTFPLLWVNAAGATGIFVLKDDRWSLVESDSEQCGWQLREIRDDVLFAAGEDGKPGCAWDLRSGRRIKELRADEFDVYVRGQEMTLGWGRTFQQRPGPTNPSPQPMHSNAAALIEWRVIRSPER